MPQLVELQAVLPEIQALNAEIWPVSPDSAQAHAKLTKKEGIELPILLDADLAVIKAFGILNEKASEVPHPTVVAIDDGGVVRFFHLDENCRPPAEEIVEAVRELKAAHG